MTKIFSDAVEIASGMETTDDMNRDIFNFIVKFGERNKGNSPTIPEIGLAIDTLYGKEEGTTSTSVIFKELRDLEEAGMIEMPVGETGRRYSGRIIVKNSEWTYGTATRADGSGLTTES